MKMFWKPKPHVKSGPAPPAPPAPSADAPGHGVSLTEHVNAPRWRPPRRAHQPRASRTAPVGGDPSADSDGWVTHSSPATSSLTLSKALTLCDVSASSYKMEVMSASHWRDCLKVHMQNHAERSWPTPGPVSANKRYVLWRERFSFLHKDDISLLLLGYLVLKLKVISVQLPPLRTYIKRYRWPPLSCTMRPTISIWSSQSFCSSWNHRTLHFLNKLLDFGLSYI